MTIQGARSDLQIAGMMKRGLMKMKIWMMTWARTYLREVEHGQVVAKHRGISLTRRSCDERGTQSYSRNLQILAWAQLQHEKQPFLCLQRLVKGNNVLVDR
jgi:hypothetical protein